MHKLSSCQLRHQSIYAPSGTSHTSTSAVSRRVECRHGRMRTPALARHDESFNARRGFLRCSASSASAESTDASGIGGAVGLLKQAAFNNAVPAAQVFGALWQLEKSKLPETSWADILGDHPGGRRWRLVFTAGPKDVKNGSKSGKGGGFYFPLTAVQRWDKTTYETENGVYFGQLGALTFIGPYDFTKKKMSLDYTKLALRLGPKWLKFDIKLPKKDGQPGPFFLFFYVDDEIACARGRGGGYAIWQRTSPEWELKAGVTL